MAVFNTLFLIHGIIGAHIHTLVKRCFSIIVFSYEIWKVVGNLVPYGRDFGSKITRVSIKSLYSGNLLVHALYTVLGSTQEPVTIDIFECRKCIITAVVDALVVAVSRSTELLATCITRIDLQAHLFTLRKSNLFDYV